MQFFPQHYIEFIALTGTNDLLTNVISFLSILRRGYQCKTCGAYDVLKLWNIDVDTG
jgi:hypothetical protein